MQTGILDTQFVQMLDRVAQVLGAFDGIQSTAENLQTAIGGENYEVVSMYPPMLADAESEGDKRAARSFKWALEVEKVHEAFYRDAADTLGQGKDLAAGDYYVCPVCGYIEFGKPTDPCPICGTKPEKFAQV